jgi:hypothetical protein
MNGASAPPEPTFEGIADAFGVTPEQLGQLVTSPQGSQVFGQLAANYGNQQNNAAQAMGQGVLGGQNAQNFMVQQAAFQNAFIQPPNPPTDEEILQISLRKMNPIAREKYEPVFKLLGIKLRYTGHDFRGPGWIIQKQAANGKQYRMTWSSPENDIGCALSTWDAMVGELLDQCKRADDGERNDHRT